MDSPEEEGGGSLVVASEEEALFAQTPGCLPRVTSPREKPLKSVASASFSLAKALSGIASCTLKSAAHCRIQTLFF